MTVNIYFIARLVEVFELAEMQTPFHFWSWAENEQFLHSNKLSRGRFMTVFGWVRPFDLLARQEWYYRPVFISTPPPPSLRRFQRSRDMALNSLKWNLFLRKVPGNFFRHADLLRRLERHVEAVDLFVQVGHLGRDPGGRCRKPASRPEGDEARARVWFQVQGRLDRARNDRFEVLGHGPGLHELELGDVGEDKLVIAWNLDRAFVATLSTNQTITMKSGKKFPIHKMLETFQDVRNLAQAS